MNPLKQLAAPTIKVLDHGFIRLIDCMGSDLSIVRAARVSYDADWRDNSNEKKDEKLISYLLANKHTSPFESVIFTFEIKCPIFIRAQWHRHRTWAYNEVSARYTELPNEYYMPEIEQITTQSKDNKQMRTEEQNSNAIKIRQLMKLTNDDAMLTYSALIHELGCPRELARSVLPVSTYTRFFGTVNLHNLLHFLTLRMHSHAQYEIRVYAEAIHSIISEIVPVTMRYWDEIRSAVK